MHLNVTCACIIDKRFGIIKFVLEYCAHFEFSRGKLTKKKYHKEVNSGSKESK